MILVSGHAAYVGAGEDLAFKGKALVARFPHLGPKYVVLCQLQLSEATLYFREAALTP